MRRYGFGKPCRAEAPSYVLSNKIGSVQFQNLRGVALDEKFFYLADEKGTLSIWQGLPTTGNEEPFATITAPAIPLNTLHSDGTYLSKKRLQMSGFCRRFWEPMAC